MSNKLVSNEISDLNLKKSVSIAILLSLLYMTHNKEKSMTHIKVMTHN